MRIVLAALLIIAAPLLHADDTINADRPGIADGSAAVGVGTFQIETGLDRSRDDLEFPTLLRYGLTKSTELRIEGDSLAHQRAGATGWGPFSAGVKCHFADAPSLGAIVRLFFPSGSGATRQTNVSGDLRLAADLNAGERWSFNPNVGIAVQRGADHFTAATGALTVQFNLSERANVFVDSGIQVPEEKRGEAGVLVDAGGALLVTDDTQLDTEATWRARGQASPGVVMSFGISHRF